jgi:hypothetical protein
MGEFITTKLSKGDPLAKIPASFFNDVDEVLSGLDVKDGYIEKTGNSWTIVPSTAGGIPTGGSTGDVLRWGANGPYWDTPGAC